MWLILKLNIELVIGGKSGISGLLILKIRQIFTHSDTKIIFSQSIFYDVLVFGVLCDKGLCSHKFSKYSCHTSS